MIHVSKYLIIIIGCLWVSTGVNAKYEISDGSVRALYHFDMDTTDSSGNSANLTTYGSPSYTTGLLGQALSFGTALSTYKAYYATSSFAQTNPKYISTSFWVKLNAEPSTNACFTLWVTEHNYYTSNYGGGSFIRYCDVSGTKKLGSLWWLRDSGSSPAEQVYTTTLGTSNWHHIMLSANGGNSPIVYLDGTAVITGVYTGTPANLESNNFGIGGWVGETGVSTNDAKAQWDEIVIFNTALSTSTRDSLYNSGTGNEVCITAGCASVSTTSTSTATNYCATSTLFTTEVDSDTLYSFLSMWWYTFMGFGIFIVALIFIRKQIFFR